MIRSMCGQWQAACKEADTDKNGTISEKEAAAVWLKLVANMIEVCNAQLKKLGK